MTVEEHNVLGGLGGAVAEALADAGAAVPLLRHGMRDEYGLIGPPTHLYRHHRLDAAGIAATAAEFLGVRSAENADGIVGASEGRVAPEGAIRDG